MTRAYIRSADLVIAPSQTFAGAVREATGVSSIFVSPSGGFDEELFFPQRQEVARSGLGLPADAVVLGYVSRIVENKGWRVFLDALRELINEGEDAYGVVVGGGPDEHLLRQELGDKKIADRVRVLGAQPQTTLPAVYAALDAFLFTSRISKTDTLGLVAVEALACGVPVVCLDTPLTREYIQPNENGVFAADWTGVSFASAAKHAVKQWPVEEQPRPAISQTVRRFRSTDVARQLSRKLRDTFGK